MIRIKLEELLFFNFTLTDVDKKKICFLKINLNLKKLIENNLFLD